MPRFGITSFFPTIISSPLDVIAQAQTTLHDDSNVNKRGATPLLFTFSTPFLNPAKKGAHDSQYLRQLDSEVALKWNPQNGVCMVTLAPELPGDQELIRDLTQQGVIVGAGHSLANYQEAREGIDNGIRYSAYLFNVMPLLHHRQPGLVGALLEDENTAFGLIVDHIHVHPAMVRLVCESIRHERLNLIADAIPALGKPPGTYSLGGQEITVDEASCRLADGTLAGSILPLNEALRNLISITSCSLPQALTSVTATPADMLGLAHKKERIDVGYDADMVLLSPELEVVATLIESSVIYTHENSCKQQSKISANESGGFVHLYQLQFPPSQNLELLERHGYCPK